MKIRIKKLLFWQSDQFRKKKKAYNAHKFVKNEK